MQLVRKNIFLILVIVLTIFAVLPLFHHGFFPMHDDEQVARVYELNYALENFHIPPRISQNLGFGYGYPFFNFYPSFAYYVSELFVLIGFGYITSIKLMIAVGFILSAVFMYLFSRKYVGDLGGLVAATLYTYAPYHSVDVYVRGALPEFFSFVFIPAIFWSIERVSRNQNIGNVIILGVLGSFLMLTHNLILLMSLPFFAAYFLCTILNNKKWKSYLISVFFSGILSLLLSAYFWIPAILENKYTMVSLLTKELADFRLHFVSLPQFLNSPWGYGGSILGPNDGFSLEVGKIHLILVALAFILFITLKIKNRYKNGAVLILFFLLFLVSVFLQSYYSSLIWEQLKILSYIQFPWRFMLLSVFTSSFIAGYIFIFRFDKRIRIALAFTIVGISILYYGQFFKPSQYLNVIDTDYDKTEFIRWDTSIKAFEYVPYGIATKKSDLNTTVVDISQDEIAKKISTPLSKGIIIKKLIDKPQYKKFEYTAKNGGKVQINTFSFPGWKVFMNGNSIGYNDMNKLKLLTISVPKGRGLIEAKFTNTLVRSIANLLSLVGIISVVVLLPFYKKRIKYEKIG